MPIITKDQLIVNNDVFANNVNVEETVQAKDVSAESIFAPEISAGPQGTISVGPLGGVTTIDQTGIETIRINATLYQGVTKTFNIPHPIEPDKRLVHGCLEGPELGVYYRGMSKSSRVDLPKYWHGLVDANTITVHLTPIDFAQQLFVGEVNSRYILVNTKDTSIMKYFFTVFAERKDVPKLEVEIDDV